MIACLHKIDRTKESVYIRNEFNSHRIDLGHQHGRRNDMLKHTFSDTARVIMNVKLMIESATNNVKLQDEL